MGSVTFNYGVFGGSLQTQAKEQGYTLGDQAGKLEDIRHALNMVGFHLATESQVKAMCAKLHKRVVAALVPLDEP